MRRAAGNLSNNRPETGLWALSCRYPSIFSEAPGGIKGFLGLSGYCGLDCAFDFDGALLGINFDAR
jgi:hypothetical protein